MADIKVNVDQWDAVPDGDKQRILEELKDIGLLQEDDVIVGDASVPPFDENTQIESFEHPLGSGCRARCDERAMKARLVCRFLPGLPAKLGCFAAVEVARRVCKGRC